MAFRHDAKHTSARSREYSTFEISQGPAVADAGEEKYEVGVFAASALPGLPFPPSADERVGEGRGGERPYPDARRAWRMAVR